MRIINKLALLGAAAFLASCSADTARISGVVSAAPSDSITVKMLNINEYSILGKTPTDESGKFTYEVDVKKGQPEFVYLFHDEVKIASLLLEAGDKVSVTADLKGNSTVEGSEESVKLQKVERDFTDFLVAFKKIADRFDNEVLTEAQQKELRAELSRDYIDYYRSAVSYVMKNSKSLTCVPVLFQQINEDFPVFSQQTDALHFRNAADSLKQVYPDSKYVKTLEQEAARRIQLLGLENKLDGAVESGFPDMNFPDFKGDKVALSSVDSKAVLVHFWTVSDAANKMFSLDVLMPLYKEYHKRGLEIYSVCIDIDKASWANTVKAQELPWINVCDGLGSQSPAVGLYNLENLPASYLIIDGALIPDVISGEQQLRNILNKNLK